MMECAAISGFSAKKVNVEVFIARGLPKFSMVGLPENSVREARVRVEAAIKNAGFDFPSANISVNLAPADLQKNGTGFDIAIALAMLRATGVMTEEKTRDIAALGELSLSGEIRPIKGMLALAECMKRAGKKTLLVAKENGAEASLIKDLNVKIVQNFRQMVEALLENRVDKLLTEPAAELRLSPSSKLDMCDVVGQEEAKRALLIAASGDHNLLLVGGPGSGKSMMAERLPSIMPELTFDEALVLTKIYSISGHTVSGRFIGERPFRAPHHSITRAGLAGGGSQIIRPGEISLACFGVLFLDEILEFNRSVLEVLRQPLESGEITLCRSNHRATFPANFSLVGALNPCPCGYLDAKNIRCTCSALAVKNYQNRISGPLLDRIDICVNVLPVDLTKMNQVSKASHSHELRAQVNAARARQRRRFGEVLTNGKMTRKQIKEFACLTPASEKFLLGGAEKLGLSARGFDRIIRVSRTIADLDESELIHEKHVGEAFYFRGSVGMRR